MLNELHCDNYHKVKGPGPRLWTLMWLWWDGLLAVYPPPMPKDSPVWPINLTPADKCEAAPSTAMSPVSPSLH